MFFLHPEKKKNEQTNKRMNEQTNEQTNKQTHKQTKKQTNKQTNNIWRVRDVNYTAQTSRSWNKRNTMRQLFWDGFVNDAQANTL